MLDQSICSISMSRRALLMFEADLYHYQRFDEVWLRELLIDDKLFMSNPAGFNDPWDCRPFFNPLLASSADYRSKLADYFARVDKKYGGRPLEEKAQNLAEIQADPRAALEMIRRLSVGISN